jgi:hypothetical protein
LKRFRWSPRWLSLLALSFAFPAYFVAYQATPALHFGIGRWDRSWLDDESSFYPPQRVEGPLRREDGSVEVQDFVARLTRKDATFRVPYHAVRSPLRMRLRCHRFGLEGTVALSVNDRSLGEFDFSRGSYPWAGIEAVIPQDVAEEGPLRIRLVTTGGDPPPSHLPQDLGVGVDWIEVEPMSKGAVLLPSASEWLRLLALLTSFVLLLRYLGTPARLEAVLLLALAGSLVGFRVFYPLVTSRCLEIAWLLVLAALVVTWAAEVLDRLFTPAVRL